MYEKPPQSLPPSATWQFDSIRQRYEEACRAGQCPPAEDFLGDTPEPQRSKLLHELRRLAADHPTRENYRVPFLEPSVRDRPLPSTATLPSGPDVSPEPRSDQTRQDSRPGEAPAAAGAAAGLALPGYEIFGELGHGGMGVVLKGRDAELGRDLAVKMLLGQHQDNPIVVQRFVEEAQIGGQLQHPGIVPVYALGRSPDGRPFFTMKLIQGQTLAQLLSDRPDPSQDLPRFLKVFEQVCQTLAYAHSQGVIHRDLKPANVMVGEFGEVQVMDWGLAKVLASPEASRGRQPPEAARGAIRTVRTAGPDTGSQAGSVLGTPAYMAPEQARGEVDRLDERCDVFGLGAILCQVLTGQPPHAGGSQLQVFARAQAGNLGDAWARLQACGADAELLRIARSCLAPDPNDRPRNAGVVAQDVSAYLTSVAERLRAAELASARAAARAEQERKARRLTVALAASVLALVLLGGGGWLWWEQDRRSRAAATAGEVNQALAEASRLWGQARTAPAGEMRRWTEALAAARRARGLLAAGEGDEDLQQRVHQLSAGLDREARAAQRRAEEIEQDRDMLARLEEARLQRAEVKDGAFDQARTAPAYAAAFRHYGVDVERLSPAEAAARLRRRAIRPQLAAALDDWAFLNPDFQPRRRLLSIARAADPDRQRGRLRDALVRNDRQALEGLARSDRLTDLPPATLVLLGKALVQAGAWEEAVAVLRRGQREHPGDFWLNHTLGYYLVNRPLPPLGRHGRQLGALLAAGPRGPLAVLAAWQLRPKEPDPAWDEAVRFYSIAAALRSRSPGAQHNLGFALMGLGRANEAAEAFRKAIALKPDYAEAHNALAAALAFAGRRQESVALLRRAIRVRPTYAGAHYNLGIALDEQGDLDGAVAAYRRAVRLAPHLPHLHLNLGVTLTKKHQFADAVAEFRQSLRLRPNNPTALFNLGLTLALLGKQSEAAGALRQAILLEPENAKAHHSLGAVLEQLQRREEALRARRRAVQLRPGNLRYRLDLAGALAEGGRVDEAAAEYREAIRRQPDEAEPWYLLGVHLYRQRKLDDALAAFRQSVRLKPDLDRGYYNLGVVLRTRGDVDGAIAAYHQALRIREDAMVYCNLGAVLCDQKRDYDGAITAFRRAIHLKSDYSLAHHNLGNALMNKGRPEEALSAFRQAVRLDPNYADAHCNLGRALLYLGQFREGLAAVRRGHELGSRQPNWRQPSAQLVRQAERLVELDGKLEQIRKGTARPADNNERVTLASFCQRYKQMPATAARFWQEAFTAEPNLAEDLKTARRYDAACAAALAGTNRGRDSGGLNDQERARWRKQALDWLRADLALWEKQLEGKTGQAAGLVSKSLRHWQSDPDLGGLRDASALARLPEPEQQACRQFWAAVEKVCRRAEGAAAGK
jgi:serine/threonine-protein kinase